MKATLEGFSKAEFEQAKSFLTTVFSGVDVTTGDGEVSGLLVEPAQNRKTLLGKPPSRPTVAYYGLLKAKHTDDQLRYVNEGITLGLDSRWLDQELTINGTLFKLLGLYKKPSIKYPVMLARVSDGKVFRSSVSAIQKRFTNKTP